MDQSLDSENDRQGSDDPRLAFIYQEALRGLTQQQSLVNNMNDRAGNLIFAAAFVSSMFGSQVLPAGLGMFQWLALILLFALGVLIAFMLWPYHKYTFRFDPAELLRDYVDRQGPASLSEMHRALALRAEADRARNWRIIQRLRIALQLALMLFLLEILAWLCALASL